MPTMPYQKRDHPLVSLRRMLGMSQKELAEVAGCSIPLLQAIESGRRKLQEKHAAAIAVKTGVRFNWLLGGEAQGPPKDFEGKPFSQEDLERLRAELRSKPRQDTDVMLMKMDYLEACWRLARSLVAASEKGDHCLCAYRISEFARALETRHDVPGSVRAAGIKLGHQELTKDGGVAWTPDMDVIWQGFVSALERIQTAAAADYERLKRERSGRHARKQN